METRAVAALLAFIRRTPSPRSLTSLKIRLWTTADLHALEGFLESCPSLQLLDITVDAEDHEWNTDNGTRSSHLSADGFIEVCVTARTTDNIHVNTVHTLRTLKIRAALCIVCSVAMLEPPGFAPIIDVLRAAALGATHLNIVADVAFAPSISSPTFVTEGPLRVLAESLAGAHYLWEGSMANTSHPEDSSFDLDILYHCDYGAFVDRALFDAELQEAVSQMMPRLQHCSLHITQK